MTRGFNEADKEKKKERIARLKPATQTVGPANTAVEDAVKSALRDGYLPCPVAFGIARRLDVVPKEVGAAVDRLGIRIIDCQLGCFSKDKTPARQPSAVDADVLKEVENAAAENRIRCLVALEIARKLKVRTSDVADAVNSKGMKIRECQLGCF